MTTDALEWARPEPDERAALEALLGQALHFPPPLVTWWVTQIGLAEFRVLRERTRIVAAVGLLRMGQWFGGRRVPLIGITAVGVALDRRGQGVGVALMRHILEELRAEGAAVSSLYPSALGFYHASGYERAGTRLSFQAPLAGFATSREQLEVEALEADAAASVKAIYAQYAAATHGALDRAPFIWARLLSPPDATATAYRIGSAAAPEGYVVLSQAGRDAPLQIRDLVMRSGAAGRQIGALVAGQRTMVDQVAWNGAPDDPFGWLLPTRPATVVRSVEWMLRIVDIAAALEERGYPPALSAELHLDVRDALLQQNSGRYILAVDDGRGTLRPGGSGRLQLDIRELAALYSGHADPQLLRVVGSLAGDAGSLALARAIFGTQRPSMADMF